MPIDLCGDYPAFYVLPACIPTSIIAFMALGSGWHDMCICGANPSQRIEQRFALLDIYLRYMMLNILAMLDSNVRWTSIRSRVFHVKAWLHRVACTLKLSLIIEWSSCEPANVSAVQRGSNPVLRHYLSPAHSQTVQRWIIRYPATLSIASRMLGIFTWVPVLKIIRTSA